MKKIIFTISLFFILSLFIALITCFAQNKKESVKTATTDSSVVAVPDTIIGVYYSFEQNKMIEYKALITKADIKNITDCTGWCFRDSENKIIAYTPCKDYSCKSLVVIPGRELDFINYLRTHYVSFK